MSFKFGFEFDDEGNELTSDQLSADPAENLMSQQPFPAFEIIPELTNHVVSVRAERLLIGSLALLRRNAFEVEFMAPKYNSAISVAANSHSDLIPNVYEGGLKTWECSIDLVGYLTKEVELAGKKVLELGCGSALPGITALLKGAQVDFQDYNTEVVLEITLKNILLNHQGQDATPAADDMGTAFVKICQDTFRTLPCRLFAGDWGNLPEVIGNNGSYDIILTSETIYSTANYDKLINTFKSLLKRPSGVVYVAAKTYYFGVGGGTHLFAEKLLSSGIFEVVPVFVVSEGVQREILKVTFKQ